MLVLCPLGTSSAHGTISYGGGEFLSPISSSRKEYPMPKTKKPFVDFRAVRARITMEQVLSHYNVLDTFKRTGSRLSGPCPIHGGTNPTQFRVDTEKQLWNCFSEC